MADKPIITSADARAKITAAITAYYKQYGAVDRNILFKPAIDSLKLTKLELKDRRSDSVYVKMRALTGSIINELIKSGSISLPGTESCEIKPKEKKAGAGAGGRREAKSDPLKERKDVIREYLAAKYLTDDEKKATSKNAKVNILKSIINDKNNAAQIGEGSIEDARARVEDKFVKAAKIDSEPVKEDPYGLSAYPNTLIGNRLRNQKEKYGKFAENKLSQAQYKKELEKTIVEAINILGGAFFETLSLDLIKRVYSASVIESEITGGSEDHGIDAVVKIKDDLGFEEKIVIQSKIKRNEDDTIGEKIIREFVGSMTFAGAEKGVLITNSKIHSKAKEFCKTSSRARRLALIEKDGLIILMIRYMVGLKRDKNGVVVIDDNYFMIG
jgi:Restriction endonuclease